MVGKTFTYLVGPNTAAQFVNSKNADLNAEEVYGKLVTPVFGEGVAYDVPNHVSSCSLMKPLLHRTISGWHLPIYISNGQTEDTDT